VILKVWKNRANKNITETGGGFVYYRRCFGMRGQQGKLKEIVALKVQFPFAS
jgi:hypothetical protein